MSINFPRGEAENFVDGSKSAAKKNPPEMNSIREQVLERVSAALKDRPRTATLPDWNRDWVLRLASEKSLDLWELFSNRLRSLNGIAVSHAEELAQRLEARGHRRGYCDPELWSKWVGVFAGRFQVETGFDRSRVDDYEFGITRASGAIAETGTLIVTDEGTTRRLAALAPWTHVAAVRKENIFPDLPSAVSAMPNDPNVVWISGPSKTADVEGILIEGVHGPGEQIAWLVE